MGFQIYTGGAPVIITNNSTDVSQFKHNPECIHSNYGKADDFNEDDLLDHVSLTQINLWQCYLGDEDPKIDVQHRLQIMTDAVEKAHAATVEAETDKEEHILKIFIAPEFFFRGKDGAYVFETATASFTGTNSHDTDQDDECEEVCTILKGLETLVANKKYKDWLFLFGTVIVSEELPEQQSATYYNFAPLYKGYDPDVTDHYGKRFLVPKRYVSNIDFLTPVRQFNDSITKELFDTIDDLRPHKQQQSNSNRNDDAESTTVTNPFELRHKYYDQDIWYKYKDDLFGLGYTMIEYDWLVLENITFTVEVCLDHDKQTALNAYLADTVLGNPTRIPKSVETYDHKTKRHTGSVEYVKIPRHQAQLSLVSSSGMTVNPAAMALADTGTIILQDGQSSKEATMFFEAECEAFSWHFAGGSECISRAAKLTSTEIAFEYSILNRQRQIGIWDDLYDDNDTTWKQHIRGVFTTERYEPKITIYVPKEIAKV